MTVKMSLDMRTPSRRAFLRGAGLCGGLALAAGGLAAGAATAAPNKLNQKAAGYRDKPMGSARCDNCAVWQGPDSCKLVQGPLSPSGWCTLYSRKS